MQTKNHCNPEATIIITNRCFLSLTLTIHQTQRLTIITCDCQGSPIRQVGMRNLRGRQTDGRTGSQGVLHHGPQQVPPGCTERALGCGNLGEFGISRWC